MIMMFNSSSLSWNERILSLNGGSSCHSDDEYWLLSALESKIDLIARFEWEAIEWISIERNLFYRKKNNYLFSPKSRFQFKAAL